MKLVIIHYYFINTFDTAYFFFLKRWQQSYGVFGRSGLHSHNFNFFFKSKIRPACVNKNFQAMYTDFETPLSELLY